MSSVMIVPVEPTSYQKALDDARKELADLPRQRRLANEYFDEREQQLKQSIEGLEGICDSAVPPPSANVPTLFDLLSGDIGLQQAIKAVLREHPGIRFSPTTIRDALQNSGFDTTSYSNPMATIHRALKRLDDDPESCITKHVSADGRTNYGWTGQPWSGQRTTHAAISKPETALGPPRRVKPKPEWWKRMTENGTKPLQFSQLTPRQRREARRFGIEDGSKD